MIHHIKHLFVTGLGIGLLSQATQLNAQDIKPVLPVPTQNATAMAGKRILPVHAFRSEYFYR